MSFPKLTKHLSARLTDLEIIEPTDLQARVLSPIKSGADIIVKATHGSGASTALVLSVVQRLRSMAEGEAPRAIIIVADKEAALALEAQFDPLVFRSDLRVFSAYDQHDIIGQRDTIFDGVDIVIGTASRLADLYLLNGVNMNCLQQLVISDAEYILKDQKAYVQVLRLAEAVGKCQKLMFTTETGGRLKSVIEAVMPRAKLLS